ncbi:hypothetical protein ABWH91_14060 [Phycisphaerales bacterium ac7]
MQRSSRVSRWASARIGAAIASGPGEVAPARVERRQTDAEHAGEFARAAIEAAQDPCDGRGRTGAVVQGRLREQVGAIALGDGVEVVERRRLTICFGNRGIAERGEMDVCPGAELLDRTGTVRADDHADVQAPLTRFCEPASEAAGDGSGAGLVDAPAELVDDQQHGRSTREAFGALHGHGEQQAFALAIAERGGAGGDGAGIGEAAAGQAVEGAARSAFRMAMPTRKQIEARSVAGRSALGSTITTRSGQADSAKHRRASRSSVDLPLPLGPVTSVSEPGDRSRRRARCSRRGRSSRVRPSALAPSQASRVGGGSV